MAFKFNPTTSNFDWVNPSVASTLYAAKLQISRVATTAIVAGDAIKADSNTHVSPASQDGTVDEATVIGFALSSVSAGAVVDIVIFGVLTNAVFNIFPVNKLLFLDVDGAITDVRPLINNLTEVGKSLGSGDIFISIKTPVVLS
jgi:hypothetical protein